MAKKPRKRKLNFYAKQNIRAKQMANALHGTGLYVFENNTQGDLNLPKPAVAVFDAAGNKKHNNRMVPFKGRWHGDSYFMFLVSKSPNEARFIETIQEPQKEKEMEIMQNNKLILDQPDTVTTGGKVEHFEQPAIKLNENKPKTDVGTSEILINEDPMEGVQIILD